MAHQKNLYSPSNALWRYQVTATLKDEQARSLYLKWLFAGHVQAVCKWALNAEVVQIDEPDQFSGKIMSIYWFKDQEDFTRYEKEGAPKLREEGIAFATSLGGISFERQVGWAWPVKRD